MTDNAMIQRPQSPAIAWLEEVSRGWNRFWFTPTDPASLAAIRICTGLVLFTVHLLCTHDLLDYVGPNAWLDTAAIEQVRDIGQQAPTSYGRFVNGWWRQSIWFFVSSPLAIGVIHSLFLIAIVCFTLGLFTRVTTVLVWVGHLSFMNRAFNAIYGMDLILAMLAFYLMFGPAGAALSIDNVWRRRRKSKQLTARGAQTFNDQPMASWTANLVIRMIQIHLCVVYLCAGLSKLQGNRWWDGTAVWISMMLSEFAPYDVSGLAHWGDLACHAVSNLGVALTLFLEISFAFLIWNRWLRPFILALAFMMHVGIGIFMGMDSFGTAMLTGCLSFVAPSRIRSLLKMRLFMSRRRSFLKQQQRAA